MWPRVGRMKGSAELLVFTLKKMNKKRKSFNTILLLLLIGISYTFYPVPVKYGTYFTWFRLCPQNIPVTVSINKVWILEGKVVWYKPIEILIKQ